MAKESKLQTYRAIASREGWKWDACEVLAFVFPDDNAGGPEKLHYALMAEPKVEYLLFDCFGLMAQIVCPKRAEITQEIIRRGESIGGAKTIPEIR